jgi:hypothetical protein
MSRVTRPQTLAALTVEGYKSVAQSQRLELGPLTVLAGANSSGKSSMLQPLLLLKQTLEAPFDPGALRLDGPNVRFTLAKQLLFKSAGQKPATRFSLSLETARGVTFTLTFVPRKGTGFDLAEMLYQLTSTTPMVRITPTMSNEEIFKIVPPEVQANESFKQGWQVLRDRCFFELRVETADKGQIRFYPFPVPPTHLILPAIEDVIHVPGLRGNPERMYRKTSAAGPTFPGTFENYAASVIAQWQAERDNKLEELAGTLEKIGLTWKVEARRVDDTSVELRVGRLMHGKKGGARDLVNIADVGFGVSQTLPVLVALLVAKPGQIVYLEQPEIHLHPTAQRRLVDALVAAAKRGVIVVAETHSTFVLREIQTSVAQGKLKPECVKLHWCTRDVRTGATKVQPASLDVQGAFGDWPSDFDDVALRAEQDYLDAVELTQVHA